MWRSEVASQVGRHGLGERAVSHPERVEGFRLYELLERRVVSLGDDVVRLRR
jgi:hypothetical protein